MCEIDHPRKSIDRHSSCDADRGAVERIGANDLRWLSPVCRLVAKPGFAVRAGPRRP